jgi:hypothetical protein
MEDCYHCFNDVTNEVWLPYKKSYVTKQEQRTILHHFLSGKDAFVCLPTGRACASDCQERYVKTLLGQILL